MCGIVGVVGRPGAVRLVIDGLHRLEYRGYDSCGYAYRSGSILRTVKTVGGVANLQAESDGAETVALGHTRWATHGGVTQANAHPHPDCTQRIAVVHNGIIENHVELRNRLESDGHVFRSQTDTEVLPHLLEEAAGGPLLEALRKVLPGLRGSYSIAATSADAKSIVFAKNSTPLILGLGDGANYLASDPQALAPFTNRLVYIEDGEHGIITDVEAQVFDAAGKSRPLHPVHVEWQTEASEKAGFPHYMLKEIYESPQVVNRVLSGRVLFGPPYLDLDISDELLQRVRRVKLLGAGTSHHACLAGASYIRTLAGLPAQAELASEYKDADPIEEPGTLILAVSQSGETLDTLQAIKAVESHGYPIVAVTNNPHSSIARRADAILPLNAGPEVSVAATKTFLAQAIVLLLFALRLGRLRGRIADAELAWFSLRFKSLPRFFSGVLDQAPQIAEAGQFLAKHTSAFVLAKGLNLHAAQEGALKLKEIAYQHAEAYSAGELKHGPFALLTPQTPVVALASRAGAPEKLLSNLAEVRARGSPILLFTIGAMPQARGLAALTIELPDVPEFFQPLVFSNALHLLAYEAAKQRGCEIDRPRNLAKSVTVE